MPSKISLEMLRARGIAILLLLFVPAAALLAQPAPRLGRLNDGTAYREDRILIIPKAGRAAALDRFHGQSGTRIRRAFPNQANIHVLELPPGVSAQDMVNRYRQSGHPAPSTRRCF